MSGHSHWSSIKHKKASADAKRGKAWSKVARMIIVAARRGGGDPDTNLTLRYAIDKAKNVNMPKDTIEKAIKKATGEGGTISFEEIAYEGYGPKGVAIMVDVLTDNRTRTVAEIKKIFERHNGSLGSTGCVNWMFHKKGLITVKADAAKEDDLMEIALAAGADDLRNTGELYEITCQPAAFEPLKKAIEAKAIPMEVAELSMVPSSEVLINDAETARKIIALMDEFEDNEDVQNAYANFNIPDDIMAKAS
ncbi:MAG: YebC/PmpR family DNA-binding transcriptional regulator [Sedimentisphaerales bacterium]|nr:YebC/PmpR family DNA-binding transcriptional regulator [Sedimentisphaerales bacterium]